ncbi:MAG TPA: sigma factor-like helix-turn-helix DNA-binding protein [Armatimonadota bacterium]|jgi:DNA-binding CsgD family transcriptional regulator
MPQDLGGVERLYLRLLRNLTPEGHRTLRGQQRPFYTERQWERKLRVEGQGGLPEHGADPDPCGSEDLLLDQIRDLLLASGLTPRQIQVARLRLSDHTLEEVAEALGISRGRVAQLIREMRARLGDNLSQAEDRLPHGAAAHYGWQEVLLQTTRRRSTIRRCFR